MLSFSLYVYYLTCAFNLLSSVINLVSRSCDLITYGFEVATRGFELVTITFEFLTSEADIKEHFALRHGCSPVNLLDIFRIPLPRNISGSLLL